jgi:hypothetical protein
MYPFFTLIHFIQNLRKRNRKAPKSPFHFVLIIRRAWVRNLLWTPLLVVPASLHGYHHTPLLRLQRGGFIVSVKLRRMASQSVRSSRVEPHLKRPPLQVSFPRSSACYAAALTIAKRRLVYATEVVYTSSWKYTTRCFLSCLKKF